MKPAVRVVDSVDYQRRRAIYADVRVYEDSFQGTGAGPGASGAVVGEPIVLEFETEQHTETYVTILDADGGELITAIEFLSPTNKRAGDGRDEYRRKRDELIASHVNVVEIDLVRRGSWRQLLQPVVAPARVRTSYRVITRRAPSRELNFIPSPSCNAY